MGEERIEKLLAELTDATAEAVRPGLAGDIKQQIPPALVPRRSRMSTINIMIDLRVSRLAAAAVIIIAMVLMAHFFGNGDLAGNIYQDSRAIVRYFVGGKDAEKANLLTAVSEFYGHLASKGTTAVFYDSSIGQKDAVMMYWKLANGNYKVIFGDLSAKILSAEELIGLQSQMLRNKHRKN